MDLMQRRRELMMMGGGGYIKNGLVFHLDGIDKGTTDTTKWVDLVGGIVFTEQSGVSTWQDTYMEFNRDRWYKGDVLPNFPFSTHTIEVCGNFRQDWQGYLLMGNKMIGLGRDVNGVVFVGFGNNCSFTVPNQLYVNTIYSVNGQIYMVNGVGDVISGTANRNGNFSKPVIERISCSFCKAA